MDRAGNQPLSSTRRKVRSLGLFLTLSRLAFPTMTNSSLARVIATLNPKGQHSCGFKTPCTIRVLHAMPPTFSAR